MTGGAPVRPGIIRVGDTGIVDTLSQVQEGFPVNATTQPP